MSQKQGEIKHNLKDGTVEIPVPEEVYAKLEATAEKHGNQPVCFRERIKASSS